VVDRTGRIHQLLVRGHLGVGFLKIVQEPLGLIFGAIQSFSQRCRALPIHDAQDDDLKPVAFRLVFGGPPKESLRRGRVKVCLRIGKVRCQVGRHAGREVGSFLRMALEMRIPQIVPLPDIITDLGFEASMPLLPQLLLVLIRCAAKALDGMGQHPDVSLANVEDGQFISW
jgi:hypothetical protein